VPGAAPCERELYEDAGDGYGESARRTLWCDGRALRLSERSGGYVPPRAELIVESGGAVARMPESAGAAQLYLSPP
jgi:hypothetical protein